MLTVDDLAMWRGDHCVFEGLSFELLSGQLALLVGPNGAGKTTLLRVIAGLTLPSTGAVSWCGVPVRALTDDGRKEIAYRGHLDGLKRDLSIVENLRFAARLIGLDEDGGTATDDVIAELGLTHRRDARVRELSAGQRRRTALAALRHSGARLWILDEPMTHLDADGQTLVARWINEHVDGGGLAVVATHRPGALTRSGTLMVEL